MFRILLIIILLACRLLAEFGDTSVSEDFGFQYTLEENGIGSVRYITPDHSVETISDGEKTYKKIVLPSASHVSDPGQPDLPSSSTFIAVNPGKTYSINVNIVSSQVTDDIEILPKNSWENNAEISFTKGEVYNSTGFYPQNIATISETMIMRELAVVNLTVTPIRYYPQEKRLEEFTEIEIELVETGDSGNSVFQPAKRSRAFEPLYQS